MPRARYIKPPGRLPAIEQIQRSEFRFRKDQWHTLTNLLLGIPPNEAVMLPNKVKTVADWVIQLTEEAINSHLTAGALISEERVNPANVRAAIRRLRLHLWSLFWSRCFGGAAHL